MEVSKEISTRVMNTNEMSSIEMSAMEMSTKQMSSIELTEFTQRIVTNSRGFNAERKEAAHKSSTFHRAEIQIFLINPLWVSLTQSRLLQVDQANFAMVS
jgi:hypothetical protein